MGELTWTNITFHLRCDIATYAPVIEGVSKCSV